MQFQAVDINGQMTPAHLAVRKTPYTCPECRGIVHVRQPIWKRAHFYHLPHLFDCRQKKGKSLRHLAIQKRIGQLLLPKTCQLEVPFPQISRIADVFCKETSCVFEVQCSSIKAEEVIARVRDYRSLGLKIVWIFSAEAFFKCPPALQRSLERVPHYFTDITFRGFGEIFDRQNKKWQTFPIDLAKPFFPKDLPSSCVPPHLQQRREFWEIGFEGDLLGQCLHRPYTSRSLFLNLKHRYRTWLENKLYKLWH